MAAVEKANPDALTTLVTMTTLHLNHIKSERLIKIKLGLEKGKRQFNLT